MYDISRKKHRGQRRKLDKLVKRINEFSIKNIYNYHYDDYDHFHVPCASDFLDGPKVKGYVKTTFCQTWLDKTQEIISQKPIDADFCKVVCVMSPQCLWDSQIIIFYDKQYYKTFWNRNEKYQKWIPLDNNSFKIDKKLITNMIELGFKEIIDDEDGYYTRELWFYGELD